MVGMTAWIYIIKSILKSNTTTSQIRTKLLSGCLLSEKKLSGAYQVDPEKVWNELIMKDHTCIENLRKLEIENVISLISYYEEAQYQKMRKTFPRNHHKKG